MFAFVTLDLVSSVTNQESGREVTRLRDDLCWVECDV